MGYTNASGSSSCAAVCAANKLGLVDNNVTVHMPGGNIDVNIDDNGYIYMVGTVFNVGKGSFSSQFWRLLQ